MAEGRRLISTHFGVTLPPNLSWTYKSAGGKGPVEVSDLANPWIRTVANIGSGQLGLCRAKAEKLPRMENLPLWVHVSGLHHPFGEGVFPNAPPELARLQSLPVASYYIVLTCWKDFSSILPVSALQVTVGFC